MGVLRGPTAQRKEEGALGGAAGETAALRNERVAQLLAGVAHEVRNPLHAMAIHAEVLADKLRERDGALASSCERNLQAIRSQIRRLDEIVRRYSDFAQGRVEAGGLAELLEGAVALCSYSLRRSGLEVELDLPADLSFGGPPDLLCFAVVELLLVLAEGTSPGQRLRLSGWAEGDRAVVRMEAEGAVGGGLGRAGERLRPVAARIEEEGGLLLDEAGDGSAWTLTFPRPGPRVTGSVLP